MLGRKGTENELLLEAGTATCPPTDTFPGFIFSATDIKGRSRMKKRKITMGDESPSLERPQSSQSDAKEKKVCNAGSLH